MEINKQVFEDVLAGKLKGTFVLRNGRRVNSKYCHRNTNTYRASHPYCICCDNYYFSFKSNGKFLFIKESERDIIDFIPDTDMKENELTIEIPNNKVVDWDESKKQNKIVFKDKQLTYNDIIEDILKKHQYEYISPTGQLFLTKHIHKCLVAKNKLTTVAKYLNDGWKVDPDSFGYIIIYGGFTKFKIEYTAVYSIVSSSRIVFKSRELAQQAIEILGEETVKLALEPLGI